MASAPPAGRPGRFFRLLGPEAEEVEKNNKDYHEQLTDWEAQLKESKEMVAWCKVEKRSKRVNARRQAVEERSQRVEARRQAVEEWEQAVEKRQQELEENIMKMEEAMQRFKESQQ